MLSFARFKIGRGACCRGKCQPYRASDHHPTARCSRVEAFPPWSCDGGQFPTEGIRAGKRKFGYMIASTVPLTPDGKSICCRGPRTAYRAWATAQDNRRVSFSLACALPRSLARYVSLSVEAKVNLGTKLGKSVLAAAPSPPHARVGARTPRQTGGAAWQTATCKASSQRSPNSNASLSSAPPPSVRQPRSLADHAHPPQARSTSTSTSTVTAGRLTPAALAEAPADAERGAEAADAVEVAVEQQQQQSA